MIEVRGAGMTNRRGFSGQFLILPSGQGCLSASKGGPKDMMWLYWYRTIPSGRASNHVRHTIDGRMHDPESKRMMLLIAEGYENLSAYAERQAKNKRTEPVSLEPTVESRDGTLPARGSRKRP
jgi:hypothetical protein